VQAAIILGLVQGLTEFLPVSSSGHLILLPWIFHWEGAVDTLAFDVVLHAGTLVAVLAYFASDLVRLVRRQRWTVFYIGVATVPAVVAGMGLKPLVEGQLRGPVVVAAMLAVFGLVMWLAERSIQIKIIPEMKFRDALIIGCAQALAIVPGVSRSGATIAAALFAGYRREEAARFSFLMSIPVIGGAALLELRELGGIPKADVSLYAAGFLASALSGLWAIAFLMKFFRRHSLDVFVYYRWVLAVVIGAGVWFSG